MQMQPDSLAESEIILKWLPLAGIVAVVGHYFWFVASHAINIPHQDDIVDLLNFILASERAGSFGEWFQALNAQHASHRVSASRLLVYLVYLTTSEIDYRVLTLVGNLALALILGLFFLRVREDQYRWVWLLVAALLLFHLRTYRIVLWGQASIAYHYVFLYAFASLFALHKVTPLKFALAAGLAVLSTFTMASGQVVWLLGLVSLGHQWLILRRAPLSYAILWLLLAAAALWLWRLGFVENHTVVLVEGSLWDIAQQTAVFFLAILGSAFADNSASLAAFAGLIIFLVFTALTLSALFKEDVRLELCASFAVAFAAAITYGRLGWLTPEQNLQSRYSLISVILVSTLALLLQVRLKVFRSPAVYSLVLLCLVYWSWATLHFRPKLYDMMQERYTAYNRSNYRVWGFELEETQDMVRKAAALGIYSPPCKPYPRCEYPARDAN